MSISFYRCKALRNKETVYFTQCLLFYWCKVSKIYVGYMEQMLTSTATLHCPVQSQSWHHVVKVD